MSTLRLPSQSVNIFCARVKRADFCLDLMTNPIAYLSLSPSLSAAYQNFVSFVNVIVKRIFVEEIYAVNDNFLDALNEL